MACISYIWGYSIICALPPALGISSYFCFIPNLGPCEKKQWCTSMKSKAFVISVTLLSWGKALVIMIICYWKIFTLARRQGHKISFSQTIAVIQLEERRSTDSTGNFHESCEVQSSDKSKHLSEVRGSNRKLSKQITIGSVEGSYSLETKGKDQTLSLSDDPQQRTTKKVTSKVTYSGRNTRRKTFVGGRYFTKPGSKAAKALLLITIIYILTCHHSVLFY